MSQEQQSQISEGAALIQTLIGKVEDLENASIHLGVKIDDLSTHAESISDLEAKTIELGEQTRLAMESSLGNSDLLEELRPKLTALDQDALRRSDLRRRFTRYVLFTVVLLMFTTYFAVSNYATYSSNCLSTTYLSTRSAWICDHLFIGDKPIKPGPQYSGRLSRP